MTTLASPPADTAAAAAAATRGSLLRAEVRRIRARRFIRLLLAVAAAVYLLAVGIAATTEFAKTTPERLAEAQRNVEQVVAEQNRYREQCLADPARPPGVPDEQVCGPPPTAEQFRAEDFLDKRPFVLADDLPGGSLAVAVAVAALAFVIGATAIGAEWSSRSIVALLFWEPRRLKVIGAKLAIVTAAAALLGVVGQALWGATAYLMAATLGRTGPLPDGFYGALLAQQGRAVLLVVLAALLGFGLSNLVRNTGAALGVGFVYFAIVETAVRNIRSSWQEWLITDNAVALLQRGGHRVFLYDQGFVDEQGNFVNSGRELVLSNLHGALVLGLVTAALVTAGAVLFARRDLH